RQRYSFLMRQRRLVVESISVEASLPGDAPREAPAAGAQRAGPPRARAMRAMFSGGQWRDKPGYDRMGLQAGDEIDGPAIISEPNQTIVVEPDWRAVLTAGDHWVITRSKPLAAQGGVDSSVNPIMLEVFNNLFMSIADQMGLRLQNTAYSVNIKERLDFSCAIFDV